MKKYATAGANTCALSSATLGDIVRTVSNHSLVLQANLGESSWVCWHVVADEYRVLAPPVSSMAEFLALARTRQLEPVVPDDAYEQMRARSVSPPRPASGRWFDLLDSPPGAVPSDQQAAS